MRFLLAAACAVAFPGLAQAEAIEASNMAGADTANGRLAIGWVDGLFNKCDAHMVFQKYVDQSRFKDHPAPAGDIVEAEDATFKKVCAMGIRATIRAVVTQADLVVVLAQLSTQPDDTELTEWFRIRDGKIVDHWDMTKAMKPGQHAFE